MERAAKVSVSLFPAHMRIVEEAARELQLRGYTFSPAIQYILSDWQRLRQERESNPQPAAALRAEHNGQEAA